MVVGSFASSYWGCRRTTHDADLLVDIPLSKVPDLATLLEASFYAPDFAMLDAVERHDHFSAIHVERAFKVDFWLRTDARYDLERFSRRRHGSILGRRTWVSSAEDTILIKLVWHREFAGVGPRLLDAIGVYEVQAGRRDQCYLDRWAGELGLDDLLREVRSFASHTATAPAQLAMRGAPWNDK